MPSDDTLAVDVAVMQADRDAAAFAARMLGKLVLETAARSGDADKSLFVQAFARHRIEATRRLREERDEARAALRTARGWVVTCSESATARRDLKLIDAILDPANKGRRAQQLIQESE